MSLSSALSNILDTVPEDAPAEHEGFDLPEPVSERFTDIKPFRQALTAQHDAIAHIPASADMVTDIGLDGAVHGTDYRLSKAAFGDRCHFSGVPVKFARKLATLDPGLAQEVFHTMIERVFHKSAAKTLVVDTRYDRIEGIVGTGTYKPIGNADVFDFAMSAVNGNMKPTNLWLCGPFMRVTAGVSESDINPGRAVHGKKVGDIVALGMSVENAIHGDQSVRVSDYAERLVCTNGMTSREAKHSTAIRHQGDIEMAVAHAVLRTGEVVAEFIPLMEAAAAIQITEPERVSMLKAFLSAPGNGGGKALAEDAISHAVQEAKSEGQPEGMFTLWNVANGVNVQEHRTENLHRKTQLETLAYSTMKRFGAVFANSDN